MWQLKLSLLLHSCMWEQTQCFDLSSRSTITVVSISCLTHNILCLKEHYLFSHYNPTFYDMKRQKGLQHTFGPTDSRWQENEKTWQKMAEGRTSEKRGETLNAALKGRLWFGLGSGDQLKQQSEQWPATFIWTTRPVPTTGLHVGISVQDMMLCV